MKPLIRHFVFVGLLLFQSCTYDKSVESQTLNKPEVNSTGAKLNGHYHNGGRQRGMRRTGNSDPLGLMEDDKL